jgi:hypothetical protein
MVEALGFACGMIPLMLITLFVMAIYVKITKICDRIGDHNGETEHDGQKFSRN